MLISRINPGLAKVIKANRQNTAPWLTIRNEFELFAKLEEAGQGKHGPELQAQAEVFLRNHFANLFLQPHGRSTIEFARHLVDEFLADPAANVSLVFHLMGSSGLEKVTRLLAPDYAQDRIHGLFLSSRTLGVNDRLPHSKTYPIILKYLLQEEVLTSEKLVFADTAYYGTLPKLVCDMLSNHQFIKYAREELGMAVPRHTWNALIRLYCLRGNPKNQHSYNIIGYNHLRHDITQPLLAEAAYIIDTCYLERPSEVTQLAVQDDRVVPIGQARDTLCRRIMEEELLKAAEEFKKTALAA